MSCAVPLKIADNLIASFSDFKRGKSEHNWIAYRLTGSDLNTLEVADAGPKGATYDEFVERALVGSEPRFCFVHFSYDLGDDGKREKCVLVLWVPPKAGIKAKMLSAAARSTLKKTLGFGYGIEISASDKDEAAAEHVLEKCKSISR